jgi:hypothetical protein
MSRHEGRASRWTVSPSRTIGSVPSSVCGSYLTKSPEPDGLAPSRHTAIPFRVGEALDRYDTTFRHGVTCANIN